MEYEIVKGDITRMKVDSIVLPANSELREGRGASEAIFRQAGRKELAADCKRLAPVDVGSAIPTSGYRLPAEYILHAVVPKWKGGTENEYALLSSAYLSSLSVADMIGCKSIAFPLLAAGNNGFDPRIAFSVARESILWFTPHKNLEKVFLVIYSKTAEALILSQGYSIQNSPAPMYLSVENSSSEKNLLRRNLKPEAAALAKDILMSAKKYWDANKDEIVAHAIDIALKAAKLK